MPNRQRLLGAPLVGGKQNLDSVLASCQNEFLNLEIELREISQLGPISARALNQRLERMNKAKQQLIYLQTLVQADELPKKADEIPNIAQRDRRCQSLTQKYYKTIRSDLGKFQEIASYLKKIIHKTIHGSGSNFFHTFTLSSMKRKLLQFDQHVNLKKSMFQEWYSYSKSVEKACSQKYQDKDLALLPHLKNILLKWDQQVSKTSHLRAQIDFEREHTNWLEQWLLYQEQRLKLSKPRTRS